MPKATVHGGVLHPGGPLKQQTSRDSNTDHSYHDIVPRGARGLEQAFANITPFQSEEVIKMKVLRLGRGG